MSEQKRDLQQVPWWQRAVFYQIYPRSFQDSNGDGIGDIPGIIRRLDYLNDGRKNSASLGVDALWISPFYPSPMTDFGYDISNYTDVDAMFGSLDDFKTLLKEARKRNIKVIIDLVLNHTSDQHPWFLESRSSKDNPKRDWYLWHPGRPPRFQWLLGKHRRPRKPNNWLAIFELKGAWWWDKKTRQYYLGTFTRSQPEVNWRNLELREAMYDVMRFWLDLGADGFRLDVVNWFVKDDEFRSNPWSMIMSPDLFQDHIYDRNRPETHDICRRMRALSDEYTTDERRKPAEERVLVGEVFTKNAQLAAEFHGYNNDQLHMAFNFDFLYQPWNARAFYQSIMRWYEAIPAGAWPNFTLSNHDQPRHYGRYKKPLFTEARARVAAAMLLTLKGTPFLYYGEEIGMDNLPIRRSDLQDPFGKKTWPIRKFGRDPERTPMQWDSSPYAGFTEHGHRPWLPIPRDSVRKNVDVQLAEPDSLLNFYRHLIALRKEHPVLQIGEITFLVPGTRNLLAYRRELPQNDATRSVAVFLNFGMRKVLDFQRHIIQAERQRFARRSWTVLLGTHRSAGDSVGLPTLQACEVLLLIADQ